MIQGNHAFQFAICLLTLHLAVTANANEVHPGTITDAKRVKDLERTARSALTSAGLTDAKKKAFREYYRNCVIYGMTSNDAAANGTKFPAFRDALQKALIQTRNDPETHKFLVDEFFNSLYKIAAVVAKTDGSYKPSKYSPAARINAMLAIGQLNTRELRRSGATVEYAVPYSKARTFMLGYLTKTKPDALHVAALIGLKRHVSNLATDPVQRKVKANQDAMNRIAREARKIVARKTPEGITEEGEMWMKVLAIETLGCFRSRAFIKDFLPVLNNEQAPLELRCAAADALAVINYSKANTVNANVLVGGLARIALLAITQELNRVKPKLDDDPGRFRRPNRNLFAPGRNDADDEQPVDPLVQEIRRQILSPLDCVYRAVLAAEKTLTVDANGKAMITEVKTQIKELSKVLTDEAKTMQPLELFQKVEVQARGLERTIKNIK